MVPPPARPRTGKRLLVAAVGVATVSFASTQGCEPEGGGYTIVTSGNLVAGPPYEAGTSAVTAPDARLPGPASDASVVDPRQPRPDAAAAEATRDAASVREARDAGLPTSGNLLPPPRDAAVGDAASKEAGRPVLPPSGNLLPAPPVQDKGR
jgi:hypothetical protein